MNKAPHEGRFFVFKMEEADPTSHIIIGGQALLKIVESVNKLAFDK